LLDDVIRHGLVDIFSILNFDRIEAFTIKLTRDAELEIDEDLSQSLIKKVYKSLKQRKEGSPVRLIYDSQIPRAFLDLLTRRLGLTDSDTIIPGGRYHNFKDFMNFPIRGMSQMKYTPIAFLGHKDLDSQKSLLEAVKRKDILLHFPYQSFDYVIDLLREASIDPKVTSIKITLYRVARNSSVVNALINAVRNGKAVTVVLELQARFDEEANINWANRLQEEGARVIYGVPGLKVHSKLCLITIKEKGKPFHYALIGTGNFNEDTARIYGDHSLLTVDKRLTKEVANIFEFFESNYKLNPFKHLIVSPFQMRKKLSRLIQHEIKNAEIGREAYIILKLNNLVDPPLIKKLYEASEAGVKIRLIVRSMFSLVPGVPQLSSNIEAISIVDKFLEHSRVFVFCNGGNARYFISSADIMQRNIDHRLEVTCPIYDKSIQDELKNYLEIQWRDNVKARILNDGLTNSIKVEDSGKKIRSQLEIYDYLRKLTSKDTQKI
jgi:polyphosphate kinase